MTPTRVTQNVPMMKGKKPNWPWLGSHARPKIKVHSGCLSRIGKARQDNAPNTNKTSATGNQAFAAKSFPASPSKKRLLGREGSAVDFAGGVGCFSIKKYPYLMDFL